MCFAARRAPACSLLSLALLILVAAALEGCGQPTREQEFVKNNPKTQPLETVAKFAGHVTVDGVTEVGTDKLFVFLADPQHPEKRSKYVARCEPDGKFEFTTYAPGDGVPLGKYIIGFVALRLGTKGNGAGPASGPQPYRGPDGLKNLYNDPDVNKDIAEFMVEVTEPGRTNYDFSLSAAGKEARKPGPHAVKALENTSSDF